MAQIEKYGIISLNFVAQFHRNLNAHIKLNLIQLLKT